MHLLARHVIICTDAPQQLLGDVPLHLLLHSRRDLHIRQLTKQHQIDDVPQIKDLIQFRRCFGAKGLDHVIA